MVGREIVSLQVGQCGNQIGSAFWDSLRAEHCLDTEGNYISGTGTECAAEDAIIELEYAHVFFAPTHSDQKIARHVPRSILIDLEPGVLDFIRGSTLGNLFKPDNYVSGVNGAGSNFAKGHYTEGAEILPNIEDLVRREIENCECLQSFQLFHSVGGGTGSGLGTLCALHLKDTYPDRLVSSYSVYPGPSTSTNVVAPYNAVLSTHQLIENSDASYLLDNEALNTIVGECLQIQNANYANLNSLVSQVIEGCTSSLRFPGTLNSDVRKMLVNLVSFPRLHFLNVSQAPLMTPKNSDRTRLTYREVVRGASDPHQAFATLQDSKVLAACYIFRENNIKEYAVEKELADYNNKCEDRFVEWIPSNLQTALISHATNYSPLSCTAISNDCGVRSVFERLVGQFTRFFNKKAYLHAYKEEGMDEMEFLEAVNNMKDLVTEYQDRVDAVFEPTSDMEFESSDEEEEY